MCYVISCFVVFLIASVISNCPAISNDETVTSGTRIDLTDGMNNNGAMCLDGSVPVMYFREGFGDGMDKYHVFFEGNSWCAGIDERISPSIETCTERLNTDYGSSKNYPNTLNFNDGYLSTDPEINSLTYNWNTYYVKYCDGTSFLGNNHTIIMNKNGDKIYFRGFNILISVFEYLYKNTNYTLSSKLLMSGCDSGGLTVYLTNDYIYHNYLPSPTGMFSLSDSGFYLEYEGMGKLISTMNWIYNIANTSGSINEYCLSSFDPSQQYLCMFAQETVFYSFVPTLSLQSMYDSWQIQNMLGSSDNATINAYGVNMTFEYYNNYATGTPKHYAFFDSCYHHGGYWDTINIDGYISDEVMEFFYKGIYIHDRIWNQNQTYPCFGCCDHRKTL